MWSGRELVDRSHDAFGFGLTTLTTYFLRRGIFFADGACVVSQYSANASSVMFSFLLRRIISLNISITELALTYGILELTVFMGYLALQDMEEFC